MFPSLTDSAEQASQDIKDHGIALLSGLLTPAEVVHARTAVYAGPEVDRRAGRKADPFALDYGKGNVRVWNLLNRHPVFSSMVQHPTVLALSRQVLGWPALLGNISANIAECGSEGGKLHADQLFVPQPWPAEPQGMNVSWLLDDFTADNGATEMVPGSHHRADPAQPPALEAAEPLIAPAGTVAVFESRVWHRTGSNRSNQPRAAAFGWYTRPIYRTQENWFLSLESWVTSNASDELLTLLGYHAKGLGLVYGASPR